MNAIHLARFGNRNGAHSLLTHSGVDGGLLNDLQWRTDAPPQSDPQTMQPFVSAYRMNESFIAQVTRPDAEASRPGMVVTIAAVVPLEHVAGLDLTKLWAYLAREEPPGDQSLASGDFALAPLTGEHEHAPGAPALASKLLQTRRAAWLGPDLEGVIACLWAHLSPGNRRQLVVGAAVHREGVALPIDETSIPVLAVPRGSTARWAGWPIVAADSDAPADPALKAFFGDDNGQSTALAELLNVQGDLSKWRHLANAAELLENVGNLNHEQCRALVQLLGLIQPQPSQGTPIKAKAISRLADLTPGADFADLRGLRMVPWPALPQPGLRALLADWADAAVGDAEQIHDVLDAVSYVSESKQDDPFAVALELALVERRVDLDLDRIAPAVLAHESGPGVTSWLLKTGLPREDLDVSLATANSSTRTPDWLVDASVTHRLPRTHAAAVDVSNPVGAWEQHIRLTSRSDESDQSLANRTGASGVVAAALALGDDKLSDRAGVLVARDASLLGPGDPQCHCLK